MTSLAKHSKFPNELGIFAVYLFFIGNFRMAIQTFLFDHLSLLIKLCMGIKHYIITLIVTFEAEISCPAVWHPSEGIPIDNQFLALPIQIMAGKTCEFPFFQRKISGNFCLLLVRWKNVGGMNIAVWGLQMTLA
jgi:hypothetical protein